MSAPFDIKNSEFMSKERSDVDEKQLTLEIYDNKNPYQILTMLRASIGSYLTCGVTPIGVMRNIFGAQKCLNKYKDTWGDTSVLLALDMIIHYLNANIQHPQLVMLHDQATIALGVREPLIGKAQSNAQETKV